MEFYSVTSCKICGREIENPADFELCCDEPITGVQFKQRGKLTTHAFLAEAVVNDDFVWSDLPLLDIFLYRYCNNVETCFNSDIHQADNCQDKCEPFIDFVAYIDKHIMESD